MLYSEISFTIDKVPLEFLCSCSNIEVSCKSFQFYVYFVATMTVALKLAMNLLVWNFEMYKVTGNSLVLVKSIIISTNKLLIISLC